MQTSISYVIIQGLKGKREKIPMLVSGLIVSNKIQDIHLTSTDQESLQMALGIASNLDKLRNKIKLE